MQTSYFFRYGNLEITAQCEQCGQPFSYTQHFEANVSNTRGNRIGPGAFSENLAERRAKMEKQRQEILSTYQGIKTQKCPHCGYYQSWMRATMHANRIAIIASAITIVVVAATAFFLYRWNIARQLPASTVTTTHSSDSQMIGYAVICGGIFYMVGVYAGTAALLGKVYKDKSKVLYPAKTPALLWQHIDKVG